MSYLLVNKMKKPPNSFGSVVRKIRSLVLFFHFLPRDNRSGDSRRLLHQSSPQSIFQPGLNLCQQVFPLKIGAGLAIGKAAALVGSGLVNGAPLAHPVRCQKNTGSVLSHPECIFILQVQASDLALGNPKVAGQPIDIHGREQEHGPLQTVTAVARAVIAVVHC